jgi:hypothetical protein
MVSLVADHTIAPGGSASVHVLHEGYAGRDGDDERVAGTVTLIVDPQRGGRVHARVVGGGRACRGPIRF